MNNHSGPAARTTIRKAPCPSRQDRRFNSASGRKGRPDRHFIYAELEAALYRCRNQSPKIKSRERDDCLWISSAGRYSSEWYQATARSTVGKVINIAAAVLRAGAGSNHEFSLSGFLSERIGGM
jgi:hypothetical protein